MAESKYYPAVRAQHPSGTPGGQSGPPRDAATQPAAETHMQNKCNSCPLPKRGQQGTAGQQGMATAGDGSLLAYVKSVHRAVEKIERSYAQVCAFPMNLNEYNWARYNMFGH